MTRIAEMLRLRIVGQHGYARNLGSTPDALRIILAKFKHVRTYVGYAPNTALLEWIKH